MNQRALITGASGGIGKSFAKQLKSEGYLITAVARSKDKLTELINELGPEHNFLVADLSTEQGQSTVEQALLNEKFNVLINNAGVGTVGEFTSVSIDKQLAMLQLNCVAVTRLAHAFLSKAKSGDALVNVSSALAFMPTPGMGLYCATKAFVTSLSDSLWFEQKQHGVYVAGLCPGITETNFQIAAGGKIEDLPKNLSQTPDQVVSFALSELRKREKPTIISGYKNRMFAGMSRVLPRKSIVAMTGGMMPQK